MPGAAAFMRPFVWACALPELNDGFEIIQRLRLLADKMSDLAMSKRK
jgi:hypothetical protein